MKNVLYLLLLSAVLISCKKNVSELPAATQTGANTFGARVDAQLWVPSSAPIPGADKLEARYIGNDLIINARNLASTPKETEFEIYIKDLNGPGTYLLNQTTASYPYQTASYGYYISRNVNPINEWITSPQFTGIVNISLDDSANHIVSGTFQFDALNMYGNPDTLHVTDGRFDIKVSF